MGEGEGGRREKVGGCGIVVFARGWKVVVLGSRTVALRQNEVGIHGEGAMQEVVVE